MSKWYTINMRTTIRMQEQLLRKAKAHAAERGISLTSFIEEAVERSLHRDYITSGKPEHFELITFTGNGTYPHVDIDDGSALENLMSGEG